jgi:hypothetical protein
MGTITSVRDAVSRRTKSTTYIVDLGYRYEVNGVVYTGTRLGLTPVRHPHREDAHAEAARYPPHSTVNVYYDPKNPAKAILTLEPPRWRPIIVILAMFGCLLLVCLMAAFLHYGPKSHF